MAVWRTYIKELYQLCAYGSDLDSLNESIFEFMRIYNFVRPYKSLDNLDPAEYIQRYHSEVAHCLSHIHFHYLIKGWYELFVTLEYRL